jgi:hypothetical protein
MRRSIMESPPKTAYMRGAIYGLTAVCIWGAFIVVSLPFQVKQQRHNAIDIAWKWQSIAGWAGRAAARAAGLCSLKLASRQAVA